MSYFLHNLMEVLRTSAYRFVFHAALDYLERLWIYANVSRTINYAVRFYGGGKGHRIEGHQSFVSHDDLLFRCGHCVDVENMKVS